jgi:hypothetical protein
VTTPDRERPYQPLLEAWIANGDPPLEIIGWMCAYFTHPQYMLRMYAREEIEWMVETYVL